MAALSSSQHVTVIGGGIFGVSSAVHLARLGVRVTLVTEASFASQASGRSLSWLNSARFRSADYHRLRIIGMDRYRTLASRNEGAPWLRFEGGLTWDADDASNRIAEAFAYEQSIGYDCQLLDPADVAKVTPGIDAGAISRQGAIFNPGEGWVDLPSLIELMLQEFQTLGGKVITDAGKASVDVKGGRATGVSTASGLLVEADAILVATGSAVPSMVKDAGHFIADGTPTTLLVKSKPFSHAVRAVLNTPNVALRPTPDGSIVCDSAWSEAALNRNSNGSYEIKQDMIDRLLSEASRVLEGNPKLELESYHCGPKPVPGDGEAVIGALEGIPGYFVAFSHSGATLGLITGELIAREIVTGQSSPLLAKFRPSRFTDQDRALPS
ncbi:MULTISPECIES: NAD(P)/FAD-dependent oxidoreductase [Rhizobium/Agrobacterium group]|uniref:D-amino-acid oxidase n=2 Tax=Rhizobium/Agrobacterium group TaxID=227290 RepID=A0A2P0QJN1_AGRTU|nr:MULTISPECIES: FAD-binding oxidoreductase [Rhizobium/Agrobacterium group]ARU12484.1 D-amino-acid oxidase [Agrobacterium tumefaciens]MBB3947458.1 glycine/D-amino acid oxidase-like deaminating enzyme [Rhizobium skierniewicense]NSY52202.1 FAD-binding oxidoreductase [Agrobacterium tumefaciens]NSZ09949.1 FAD-binding oxidoreductase [Agrobacterium tumefaciens]NTB84735.1 FAD-binding oxidoreductase [Agrobacterium tumefaciens]